MSLDFLGNLLGGYAETRMGLDEREFKREQERRKARMDILSAAIPNITDPKLKAEAFALAEEFATGKTGKKQGGLSTILGRLIGHGPEDVGHAEKLREFLARPRLMEKAPEKKEPLPEIPGGPPPAGPKPPGSIWDVPVQLPPSWTKLLPREITIPAEQTTVRGPFATPEEQHRMRAEAIRGEAFARAEAQAQVEATQRAALAQEARRMGLTHPRDIANYVNQRTLPQEPAAARPVTVPGLMTGRQLLERLPLDSPLREHVNNTDENLYHVSRTGNEITGAFPAAPTATGLKSGWQRDADSTSGWSQTWFNPATGRIVSVLRGQMPPAGYLPSTSENQTVRFVPQPDGSIVAVPVTSTTTRGRVLPGQAEPSTPAPARPRAGVAVGPPTALPPVPGQAVAPTGNFPEPIKTSEGRVVVGHRALTVADRRDIGAIALARYLAEQLQTELATPVTPGQKAPAARTSGGEQASDALKARIGAFKYSTLGTTSGNPFLARTIPLSRLAMVMMASPFLKGVRAYQWVTDIQSHIPDARYQTPAAMQERLNVIIPLLEKMESDLRLQLGLSPEQMRQFMGDATAATGTAAPGAVAPGTAPPKAGRLGPPPRW